MSPFTPVVHPYEEALDRFRLEGKEPSLLRRMSELVALLKISTALTSGPAAEESLNAALDIILAETQANCGALFMKRDDGSFGIRCSRGQPARESLPPELESLTDILTPIKPVDERLDGTDFVLLCPISRREGCSAVLGLGPRAGGCAYGAEEHSFLRSVAACIATLIDHSGIQDELRRLNHELSVKVFQLHNLFDISRELTGMFEEEPIQSLIMTTVMGHFVVSRCALFRLGPQGLFFAHGRGLRGELAPLPPDEARAALQELVGPTAAAELPDGPLRRVLEGARLALAVPLTPGERPEGILAIGERASRTPFSPEDREFAQTLARQAFAALESARLHHLSLQKQRQDHELKLAREIQRGLFPACSPEVPGFEVAAVSRSCYEVGGDCYDWIHLGNSRLALVIADVSGKGTPASLLMASVHAFVQALAGAAAPAELIGRLNRFLFARTQPNTYVTLFYGELDATSGRFAYVNAGHVPPYRLARDGSVSRLEQGGLVLGVFDEAQYAQGQVLLEPGAIVALVTDGVTEASSPDELEFGDEGVFDAMRAFSQQSASTILDGLVAAVNRWTGAPGCSDDLTALILKAQ
jgi:sigma-B regulation protein RsbU (phosphoserine phosphatase)